MTDHVIARLAVQAQQSGVNILADLERAISTSKATNAEPVSTRPDGLPDDWFTELSQLVDQVGATRQDDINKVVETYIETKKTETAKARLAQAEELSKRLSSH